MRIDHDLDPSDAVAVEEMRRLAAPTRGKMLSPGARDAFDQLMLLTPSAPGVRYELGEVAGVPGQWVRVPDPRGTLVHLHGGGGIVGSAKSHRHFAGQIAVRASMDAFVPDYRLAPEHPYPAGLEDAQRVFDALPGAIVIGDSAGGALALSLRRTHTVVALSPRTDYTERDHADEADLYLTRDGAAYTAAVYLGGANARDASPVFGPIAPRTFVHVGTAELLLDDSLRLADRAEVHVWKGMPHVFPASLQLRAAHAALDHVARFVRS